MNAFHSKKSIYLIQKTMTRLLQTMFDFGHQDKFSLELNELPKKPQTGNRIYHFLTIGCFLLGSPGYFSGFDHKFIDFVCNFLFCFDVKMRTYTLFLWITRLIIEDNFSDFSQTLA